MKRLVVRFGLAVILTAAACGPVEQAHQPATAPPAIKEDSVVTGDGHTLPLRYWLPKEKPEAVIVALHGFNDYSKAFAGAGDYFSKRRIALYAYDQRGFGQTQHHGIWPGEQNLMQDVEQTVRAVAAEHPGVPIYLLGESMGGAAIVATIAKQPIPGVKGVILSAPAVWGSETMNTFYRVTLWLLAHTIPGAQVTGEKVRVLASDNIEMLRAMGRDPLVIKKTRIDAIYGIVELMDSAYAAIGEVDTPLLLLYGAHDQVIPRQSVRLAAKRLKAPHRVAFYPEGYHMLLRDLKGEIVLNDIVSWVKYSERPLPSGYDQEWEERFNMPPAKRDAAAALQPPHP